MVYGIKNEIFSNVRHSPLSAHLLNVTSFVVSTFTKLSRNKAFDICLPLSLGKSLWRRERSNLGAVGVGVVVVKVSESDERLDKCDSLLTTLPAPTSFRFFVWHPHIKVRITLPISYGHVPTLLPSFVRSPGTDPGKLLSTVTHFDQDLRV